MRVGQGKWEGVGSNWRDVPAHGCLHSAATQRTNANRGSASGTVAVTPPPHPLEEPVGRPPLFGWRDLSGVKSMLASPTPQEASLVLARAHLTEFDKDFEVPE